jgi:isopropylmalate/homocitrate/citramalate synthase
MHRDRRSYEPFAPDQIGASGSHFVLGKHSGTATIRWALAECGIHPPDDTTAKRLVAPLRRLAATRPGPISTADLKVLYGQLVMKEEPSFTGTVTSDVLHRRADAPAEGDPAIAAGSVFGNRRSAGR